MKENGVAIIGVGYVGTVIASALANDKWARHLFNSVYKGFLEIKEIKEMIDGKDFWMDPTEVKERLDKRNKHAKKTGKGMAKKAIERKKGRK